MSNRGQDKTAQCSNNEIGITDQRLNKRNQKCSDKMLVSIKERAVPIQIAQRLARSMSRWQSRT